MVKEIASFVNNEGIITPLNTNGTLIVYKKMMGNWEVDRTKDFFMNDITTMVQLRETMIEFIDTIASCKSFIGISVTGVPFYQLEKAGVSVWEFEGNPKDFLEYVYNKEQLEINEAELLDLERRQQIESIGPIDLGNGYYQVFLTKVQGSNLGVTSKQVLLPLLKKGTFYQLDVFCNHIPPWMEGEILSQSLSSKIEKINDKEMKVMIMKTICT